MLAWIRNKILSSYIRLPEHRMKYRVVCWLGRHVFPTRGISGITSSRITLLLHPRDWIEYLFLRGDAYEPFTLEFLELNLKSGELAMFAGVNFGLHTLVAARAVGAEGRIIGIEPQPLSVIRSHENYILNGFSERIQIVTAALGAAEGFVKMAWSSPENTGSASLLIDGDSLSLFESARCLARRSVRDSKFWRVNQGHLVRRF